MFISFFRFLIISLLLVASPFCYSSLLEEDVPYHYFEISDEPFYHNEDKINNYRNDLLTVTEGFDDFWPDEVNGDTALHRAIKAKDSNLLKEKLSFLLSLYTLEEDILHILRVANKKGHSFLYLAVVENDSIFLKTIIESLFLYPRVLSIFINDSYSSQKNNPLFAEINISKYKLLKEAGADFCISDEYTYETPLHKACKGKDSALAKAIAVDYIYKSFYQCKLFNSMLNGELISAFHLAAYTGKYEVVSVLSEVMDVNHVDYRGFTPLHFAYSDKIYRKTDGHLRTIRFLIIKSDLSNKNIFSVKFLQSLLGLFSGSIDDDKIVQNKIKYELETRKIRELHQAAEILVDYVLIM